MAHACVQALPLLFERLGEKYVGVDTEKVYTVQGNVHDQDGVRGCTAKCCRQLMSNFVVDVSAAGQQLRYW